MKRILCIVAGLLALSLCPALTQPTTPPSTPSTDTGGKYVWIPATNSLPRFDLNFPGGTPEELVNAIEKTTDRPLNTIIPDDCKDLKIPAFSVKNVTVADLFKVLTSASKDTRRYDLMDPTTGGIGGMEASSTYGFQTEGIPNENSIWFFHWDKDRGPWQVIASTVCRFYQLSPYLKSGYKIDDITTAVDTAWKMLGVTNPPTMSYHKDTGVLIAVGKQNEVELIGDVLKQLSKSGDKSANNEQEKSGK